MKKVSLVLAVAMLFTFLISCSSKKEYENFEELNNGVVLKHGDKVYTFFSVLPSDSLKGEQFGIINNEEKHKVYYVKDYSSDEWIIEYLDVIMSTYNLYKSDVVKDIPNELQPQ